MAPKKKEKIGPLEAASVYCRIRPASMSRFMSATILTESVASSRTEGERATIGLPSTTSAESSRSSASMTNERSGRNLSVESRNQRTVRQLH